MHIFCDVEQRDVANRSAVVLVFQSLEELHSTLIYEVFNFLQVCVVKLLAENLVVAVSVCVKLGAGGLSKGQGNNTGIYPLLVRFLLLSVVHRVVVESSVVAGQKIRPVVLPHVLYLVVHASVAWALVGAHHFVNSVSVLVFDNPGILTGYVLGLLENCTCAHRDGCYNKEPESQESRAHYKRNDEARPHVLARHASQDGNYDNEDPQA